jgi:uncharacterized protein YbjT (DUF2867 family)
MNNGKVLLCGGAAGSQGSALTAQLIKANYSVSTIARSKEKCEHLISQGIDAKPGDLGEVGSLKTASKGADYIVFLLPLERDKNKLTLYTKNVIDVCNSANIKNMIFNTSSRVSELENKVPGFAEKRMVETQLRESGVGFICLRPTIYMENYKAPWSVADINDHSCLKYPIAEDKKVMWNSADDVARYVIAALEKPELDGKVFEIGGVEAVNGKEIAEQFSTALGRQITYEGITPSEFAASLIPFLGETHSMGMVSYYDFVNAHPQNWGEVSSDIELLACEPQDSFEKWVRRLTPDVFR